MTPTEVNKAIIKSMDGERLTEEERVVVQHENLLAGCEHPHSRTHTCYGAEVRWTYYGG